MPHQTAETLRAVTDWLEIAKLVPQMSEKRCAEIHAACEAGARAWEIVQTLAQLPLPSIGPPTVQESTNLHALISQARALLDAEGR